MKKFGFNISQIWWSKNAPIAIYIFPLPSDWCMPFLG